MLFRSDDQAYYLKKYGPPKTIGEPEKEKEPPPIPKEECSDEHPIRVKNISISGMQFETGFFFPINNFVSLKIIIKSINLSVISRVVLIKHKPVGTGYIMGVEFVDIKLVERKRLLTYIHSLTPVEKQTLIRFY